MTASITALSFTPVKGTRLRTAERLTLGRGGAPENRRFYVIDDRGRMLNSKVLGELQTVVSELRDGGRLALRFPDGRVIEDEVRDVEIVQTSFFSEPREDFLVDGPFSAALSEHLGKSVRLIRAVAESGAVDRGPRGTVSLISRESLAVLASEAAVDFLDPRRFRMLIEIDGVAAHAEDAWVGRRVRAGAALLAFHGHVGRCLITSRDPETGVIDVPTLDVLREYRGDAESTEPLPFGVWGEVLEPGTVALGDPVTPVD
ncbi:MAG TPA: MOSC N-terminal beta barrel domain-containing protein [Solirubrobacteraceae bacterium]|nr:MOSC N-terminal beta barrel domain-containing protein [Solirubrobacteraceae bacterium]